MNEKLSFQNIVDSLSQKADVSKKVSETFSKAFFDTIVEALYMGEESIKIKGLGTFKLVEVEDRESINVTNGERFVISGYKKVAFVPDDSIVERLNASGANDGEEKNAVAGAVASVDDGAAKDDAVAKRVEASVQGGVEDEITQTLPEAEAESHMAAADALSADDAVEEVNADIAPVAESNAAQPQFESKIEASLMNGDIDELIEVPEPKRVEIPVNPLFGIDMLISTPESIEEVREQYKEAKERFDKAVEAAKAANQEKTRLEILLQHLESNSAPEVVDETVEEAAAEIAENIAVVAESAADDKIVERVDALTAEDESTLMDDSAESISSEEAAALEYEKTAEGEALPDAGEQIEEPVQDGSENEGDEPSKAADAEGDAAVVENAVAPSTDGEMVEAAAQPSPQEEPAEKAGGEALERLLSDKRAAEETNKEKPKKDYSTLWIISIFVVIVLGVIAYLLYKTSVSIESVEQVQTEKTATQPAKSVQNAKQSEGKGGVQRSAADTADKQAAGESSKQAADNKESKGENQKKEQKSAPKTYTIKKGDSLTRISQQFYNTKDSVSAIIRVNKFKDPNNVPIGEVINLP